MPIYKIYLYKNQEPRANTEYTVVERFANYYARLIYSLYI